MTSAQNGKSALDVAAIVSFLLFVAGILTPSAAYSEQSRADSTRTVSALNVTTRAALMARWLLGPQAFRDVVPLYAYDLVDVCPLFSVVGVKALPSPKMASPRKDTKGLQAIPTQDPKAAAGKEGPRKDPKASPREADPKASQFSASAQEVLSGEVALVTASRDRGDDSTVWIARSVDGITIMSLCENGPRAGTGFVAKRYPLPYLATARVFLQN